jgi:hypothetical protein
VQTVELGPEQASIMLAVANSRACARAWGSGRTGV